MKKRTIVIGLFVFIVGLGLSMYASDEVKDDQPLQLVNNKNKNNTKNKYKKKDEPEGQKEQKKIVNNQNDQTSNQIQKMNTLFFGNNKMDDSHTKYNPQDDPNIKIVNLDFSESPFKRNRHIFKHIWERKETTLNDVQDLTLGTGGTFMPYLRWSHLQILEDVIIKSKAKQNEINYQNNLSLLRKIANDLVIKPLEVNDFETVKKTLNICRKNTIHMWTAPDISKTEIEKKRNNTLEQKNIEKNIIQEAFFNCRDRLSKVIQDSIRFFAQKIPDQKVPDHIPEVIPLKQIEDLKTLYILAILTYNIHNQEYKKFSEVETEFSDITYIDVLRLVSPESETLVEQTLGNFRKMQEESESNRQSRGTLLKTVGSRTNLDESIIGTTKHQTI